MQFKFTKNIQFTKLIKANGRLKEFNFRKLNDHKEGMFTVDVVDERDSRVFFNIQKVENNWKVIKQPLPEWVLENESIFHDVIEEELKLTWNIPVSKRWIFCSATYSCYAFYF